MKRLFALSLTVAVITSCGDKAKKQKETPAAPAQTVLDTTDYLPVASLLNEDARNVETYAGGILRKAKVGNNKDSTYLQMKDFQLLTGQFLVKELDSTYFRNNYTETSFMDETTQMLNFIYAAKDSTASLRQVIVYIKPSLTSDKVDRIYMETTGKKDNVDIDKKLTWKMGKYFLTITTRQPSTGEPTIITEKVIWDPQLFSDQ